MIYLLILLLVVGTLQSILTLEKEDFKDVKWNTKKTLSLLYLFGLSLGIITAILNDKESNQLKESISTISKSVEGLNPILKEQLTSLSKSLEQTQSLLIKSDSIDKRMVKVLNLKESLLAQYDMVNDKLSKQLELERIQLKERAPVIDLKDFDIELVKIDSLSYRLSACIGNYGERNALIKSGNGYFIFFDMKNKPFHIIEIIGNTNKGILEPNEISNMRLCYNIPHIDNLEELKQKAYFGAICLKVTYADMVTDKDSTQYYYSGWIPNLKDFGGLKNWQYNIARKYSKDNLNF